MGDTHLTRQEKQARIAAERTISAPPSPISMPAVPRDEDPGLFADFPVEAEKAKKSSQQRHREKCDDMIKHGRHPATRVPLLTMDYDPVVTCGTCKHVLCMGGYNRSYYKCSKVEITGGYATDLRLKWPGCVMWEGVASSADDESSQ